MNPAPENESDALRNEIDATRRRMDETVDALSERLHGRHLIDEILGFFRGGDDDGDGDGKLARAKEKISESASQAARAVVDTVKANPLPVLVIGAGVAWLLYASSRKRSSGEAEDRDAEDVGYDPDLHYDRPMEYPESLRGDSEEQIKFSEMKDALAEKASGTADQVEDKVSDIGDKAQEKNPALKDRAGDKLQAAKERASEISSQMKESARRAYDRTRDTVGSTVKEHPLEIGLACLAAGVIAGLALPTPSPVHRIAGRGAERLRQRTREAGREMLEKGKHVARAAADAAREEADAQGLTPRGRRQKADAIAERANAAGADAAQRENMTSEGGHENSGSDPDNPSLARPAM
jgi:ElaB/YqjD/DUF883 family membrane-anchored ribosome-binding protein